MMPDRTARMVRRLKLIAWACALLTVGLLYRHLPWALLALIPTAMLTSGWLTIGHVSVKFPLAFDEYVRGERLTGASHDEAVKRASRRAVTHAAATAFMCLLIDAGLVAGARGLVEK